MYQTDVYYVGMDIHKKIIAFCVKKSDPIPVMEGTIPATRSALIEWEKSLPHPWIGAMEATLFTGWVYDTLKPFATKLKVANPLLLKAISASKKKNDRIDAGKIADALRADLLPECYMAPKDIRDLRRALRFRNYLVRLATSLKNKTAGLLMECGAEYNKEKLHGKPYFRVLLGRLDEVPESVRQMLSFNRHTLDIFEKIQKRLVKDLQKAPLIKDRIERLMTIKGVGEVLALTWALEIGDPQRFSSVKKAISYCGLCSAEKTSAGKSRRGPISNQRNKHLQWVLIEAAKVASRWNPHLAEIHARELYRGNRNRATLAVARKLVAYLLAVDKSGKDFEDRFVYVSEEKEAGEGRAPSLSQPHPTPVKNRKG